MPLNVQLEAPCAARANERYEWEYGQRRHQVALKNIQGQAPGSTYTRPPRSQARRRFSDGHRQAAIGLENQKLIEKLESISSGYGAYDPRAPPTKKDYRQLPGPFVPLRGERPLPSAPTSRVRSLNEPYRFRMQQVIHKDNEAFVKRILSVGTTFNRRSEARDFGRHQRASQNLQRFVDRSTLQSRSLPALRSVARPSSSCMALGLESLLVPGDLLRLGSSPALLDRPAASRENEAAPVAEPSEGGSVAVAAAALLQAAGAVRGDALSPGTEGTENFEEPGDGDVMSPTTENFASPGSSAVSPLPVAASPAAGPAGHSERDPLSPSTVVQEDMSPQQGGLTLQLDSPKVTGGDPQWSMDISTETTERRKWLSSDAAGTSSTTDAAGTSSTREATLPAQTGGLDSIPSQHSLENENSLSNTFTGDNFTAGKRGASASDLAYSAEWDEFSMSGNSSPQSPASPATSVAGTSPGGRSRPRRIRNADPVVQEDVPNK